MARNLDSLWSERGRERHRRLQRTAIRLISDLVQVAVLDRLYDAQNDIVASAFDNLIRFMDLTAAFEHSDADTIPSQPLLLAVNKRLDLLRILHRLRNATLHSEYPLILLHFHVSFMYLSRCGFVHVFAILVVCIFCVHFFHFCILFC